MARVIGILTWRKLAGGIACRLILPRRGAKTPQMKTHFPVMNGASHV
jgi:hypothetical protein